MKKTILLVEDEVLIALKTADSLAKMGYEVITAASGEDALTRLSVERAVDLVLMDIDLGGGIDGIETARIINRDSDVPVVFITNYTEPQIAARTESIASYGFIMKNCPASVLQASLKTAFMLREAHVLLDESREAIRERELKYRLIFENAPIGLVHIGANGIITDCNDFFVRIIGSSREALVGLDSFILPDMKAVGAIREALAGRTGHYEDEYRSYTGGKTTMVRAIFAPARAPGGTITGAVGIIEDISERKHAEAVLEEQKSFLATLIDTVPNPLFYKDSDGVYLGCNAAFEELLGLERGQVVGKTVYDMAPTHVAEMYRLTDDELIENPGKQHYEWVVKKKNGETRDVAFDKATYTDRQGKVAGIIGLITDLTEIKRASEALRLSEEKFRLAVDATTDGLFDWDVLSGTIYFSPSWGRILEDTSVPGNRAQWAERVHEDDRKEFLDTLGLHLDGETDLWDCEHRLRTGAGGWKWVTGRGRVVERRADGSPARMVGTITDITPLKAASEEMRRKERYFTSLFENSYDAISIMDEKGVFTYVSSAMERILGYSPAEMVGRHSREFASPDSLKTLASRHRALLENPGGFIELEWKALHKDGRVVEIEGIVQNFLNDDALRAIVVNFRDITYRRQVEAEFRKSLMEKEALLKELQHRVKNSLSIITGMTSLEMKRTRDPAARETIQAIHGRVMSMANLYTMLFRSGDVSEIDLGRYLGDLCGEILLSLEAGRKKIVLRTEITDVRIDVKRAVPLGLIANELITNCVKHAFPEGSGGEIALRLFPAGESLALEVSDNGVGMPDGAEDGNGATLGLRILKLLAEQIGGAMEIRRGGGTAVTVTFPRAEKA